jgi:hypothetical protein
MKKTMDFLGSLGLAWRRDLKVGKECKACRNQPREGGDKGP